MKNKNGCLDIYPKGTIENCNDVSKLLEFAVKCLTKMLDQSTVQFSYRRKMNANGEMINEGYSIRYTLITVLGLFKLQSNGTKIPFDLQSILMPLITDIKKINNLGDIGLLMWATALLCPQHLGMVYKQIELKSACTKYTDGKKYKTMELSWFLTGLSYSLMYSGENNQNIKQVSGEIYSIIKKNYGGCGIFRHARGKNIWHQFRNRLGSFADQVYPAYAFLTYSKATSNLEAKDIALTCVKKICSLQGPLGQWWWHYDAVSGRVAGRYPVFSVHQEGMAPMVLFAAEDLTGLDFKENIYRGLRWIFGNNEMKINMIDQNKAIIWRSIYQPRLLQRIEEISAIMHVKMPCLTDGAFNKKILFEGRSYCFGWLLYAFGNK